jgi:hypothetical protein
LLFWAALFAAKKLAEHKWNATHCLTFSPQKAAFLQVAKPAKACYNDN